MNNRRVLTVAGAVATLVAATTPSLLASGAAPQLATTTTTTTTPPTTTADGEFVLPPGFSYVVDDTDRITVAIPSAWTHVETAPDTIDGLVVPTIHAATDLDVWTDTFDAPGVRYGALPFTDDPELLIDTLGLRSGCLANTTVDYSDGVFTGLWGQWTQCGTDGEAAWHLIVASPADDAFTAVLAVQVVTPSDERALDVVLETFNTTSTATWPATPATPTATSATTSASTVAPTIVAPTTTAVAPTIAATTLPVPLPPVTTQAVATTPTLPAPTTTGLPGIGVRLVDDTNFLTVTVPGDWVDQRLDAGRHDDGSDRATITAAPDIDLFFESWAASGTRLVAVPASTEPTALLERYAYPRSCTDEGVTAYADGRFNGLRQTWVNCDGTATRMVNVAARPLDGSYTILIQVQQQTPDDVVLSQILASAGTVPGAVYPAPVPAPPLVPTGPVPPELLVAPAIPLITVQHDLGTLSMSVPSTWTDTESDLQMNDDASDRQRLAAAPVIDDFFSDWLAPGVQVIAYPFTNDPSTLLTNLGFPNQCTDGGVQSFSNGTLTGLMQTWSACGNTASRNITLALSPADQSVTMLVEIQLPTIDNTPLQAVLSSLRVG